MRVLIDDGLSTHQQLGGIGYFSLQMWLHLRELVECDLTDYHSVQHFPRVARRALYLGLANVEARRGRYDIIHYQNYYVPKLSRPTMGVATVHDMGPLGSPEVFPFWYKSYFRRALQTALRRSDAVTLSSYAAKTELLEKFPGLDEKKIFVCHHGLRSVFSDGQPGEEDLLPLHLAPQSYYLFVGNLETRKNLTFLLSAFVRARRQGLVSPDTKLVLVGRPGNGFDSIRSLISPEENIIHLGRLEEGLVVALYRHCKAFVFPSRYEGFGVPILEAMSQRVPILISGIPSSLEFHRRHNEQCLVFDLDDENSLLERLSYLEKNHEQIAGRLNYGDLSIYSYDQVALSHLNVYRDVLSRGPGVVAG